MRLFAENTCSKRKISVLNLKTERNANLPSIKKKINPFQPKIFSFQVTDENIHKTICQKKIHQNLAQKHHCNPNLHPVL